MTVLVIIAVAVVSYLIGSVSSSIILSKAISGKDIRESGSGNAGATNMLRTHGKKMGVITLVCDILKGVIAILVAILASEFIAEEFHTILKYVAGVSVVVGHDFPIFFGFKGGKGVATSLGVVLLLDWKIGLLLLIFAVSIMAITRYVSLGSVLAGAGFIVAVIVKMFISGAFNVVVLICSLILGGLLIIKHHANIKRLLNGTESKLGAKKEK